MKRIPCSSLTVSRLDQDPSKMWHGKQLWGFGFFFPSWFAYFRVFRCFLLSCRVWDYSIRGSLDGVSCRELLFMHREKRNSGQKQGQSFCGFKQLQERSLVKKFVFFLFPHQCFAVFHPNKTLGFGRRRSPCTVRVVLVCVVHLQSLPLDLFQELCTPKANVSL